MRIHQVVAVLVSSGAIAGIAIAASPPTETCTISAYAADADRSGTNVRAAPDGHARVVAVLPADLNASVTITGARGKWLRIAAAETNGTDADRSLFRGTGWIHASMLTIGVAAADPNLYAAPSRRAKVIKRLEGDDAGVILAGCNGVWAEVRIDGLLGWLSPAGQCSNPLTTCV